MEVPMKKSVFAISLLSLAIAGSNQALADSTSSQAPQDCAVEGGQGESLQEGGMWCGVGTFLAALSELEPTAAGPGDGPDLDLNVNPPGRGDADEFDPEASAEEEPVTPPAPEPEPEATPPHIVLPDAGSGEFVGYFASQDRTYSYQDEEEEDSEDEDYGQTTNHQTGGFRLSLEQIEPEDNDDDNGYGEPALLVQVGNDQGVIEYGRSDHDGAPIDSDRFSSDDDHSERDEDGYSSQRTYVRLTDEVDENGNFSAYRNENNYQGGDEDEYRYSGNGISGSEVVVYQESDLDDGYGDSIRSIGYGDVVEILKNYWAGGFSSHDNSQGMEQYSRGAFVAGELTSLDDVQRLVSEDVVGTYTGNSHQWGQPIRVVLDFGEQRFAFEASDIPDMYRKMEAGISSEQDMSFTAEGVVEGVHLISESVSTGEGFVQGSLFGEDGRIIGGGYDITKDDNRLVDVYTAVEGEGNRVDSFGGPR